MSAFQALKAARDAGIRIAIDGDAITLDADTAPPAAVLNLLSRHKAGVVALLRTGGDGWSGEDWRALFDQRAGIAEFDGGLPRASAEARASPAVSPSGSTAIRFVRRQTAASAAVPATTHTTSCCPSVQSKPVTPGCTRAAGPLGTRAGRPRRSPLFQPLRYPT